MKVFGIGLSKTGTSSLANALTILGYNVKDCLGVEKYTKGDITSMDESALLNYNALTDTPIPSFYQELDDKYPGSRFILTIRDMEGWLKSCKKQFNQKSADKQSEAHNELFFDLYGTTVFDEEKFKLSYIDFTNGVKAYFKNRPNDLLILNVSNGEGWEKLCPFLNKPTPESLFPKSNVTQIRWLNIHELAQSSRSAALHLYELSNDLTKNKLTRTNQFKYALSSFFGLDISNRIDRGADKTQKKITQELLRLDPNIPVITKTNHDTLLKNRASWNHFWLLSCSEGEAQLVGGAVGYTINLALIEDGVPYLGIIYIPEIDTLYYAVINKGVFKVQGNNSPVRIEPHPIDSSAEDIKINKISSAQSIGSLLCQAVEKNVSSHFVIESSNEWQTAAGHAILKSIGLTLIDTTDNTELKYNKKDWLNTSVTVNTP
ncbi:MAG: hypothetical protein GQ583_08470 [Methyloprofundus sp.]|nr:hypothetical protein [Methyloprofundus sp.]